MPFSPSQNLKAAGLWQKTSAKGNTYFVGRLGGVRILIFENRDRSGENDPTHILYFADGETPRAANRAPARSPDRPNGPPRSRPAYPRSQPDLPNDPIDDLWPTRR
jgi:hypothetical protein